MVRDNQLLKIGDAAPGFAMPDVLTGDTVNLTDFAAWQDCMTGPDNGRYSDGCEAFDFDADLNFDIDLKDFAGFQSTLPRP